MYAKFADPSVEHVHRKVADPSVETVFLKKQQKIRAMVLAASLRIRAYMRVLAAYKIVLGRMAQHLQKKTQKILKLM